MPLRNVIRGKKTRMYSRIPDSVQENTQRMGGAEETKAKKTKKARKKMNRRTN